MYVCVCARAHWFFAPKLDWNLPNLGRICWILEKTDRKNPWALLLSLLFCMLPYLQIGCSYPLQKLWTNCIEDLSVKIVLIESKTVVHLLP